METCEDTLSLELVLIFKKTSQESVVASADLWTLLNFRTSLKPKLIKDITFAQMAICWV